MKKDNIFNEREKYLLKEIFINELQRKTNKQIFTQELRTDWNCIVTDGKESNFVVFLYNNNQNKVWEFNSNLVLQGKLSKTICIFVCKDKENIEEYHLISLIDLINASGINSKEFFEKNSFTFDDTNDEYLNNWKIL